MCYFLKNTSFLILKYENKEIGSKRTRSLSSLVKYPSFRPESKFSIMFFSTFIKSRDNGFYCFC